LTSTLIDRAGFLAALDQQLDVAREDGSILGLAVIDVRDFNRINGVYGFAAGDLVLAEIAERLAGISRKSPVSRRVGANQFAVIFSGIASPELLPLIGSRIVRTVSESLLVGAQEIVFDVQVGLAAFPSDAWNAEQLYFLAEQALRLAKRDNAAYAVHAPDELQRQKAQWKQELELGDALAGNELQLWYQPRISIADGVAERPEALLRWLQESGAVSSPERMVPAIEQGGRGAELARWVLNTALRQSRRWSGLGVSVNVSAIALALPEAVDTLNSALRIWNVPPEGLTVEVGEHALARGAEACEKQLQPLREAGIRIAVDSFGTGNCSLSQFKSLRVDEIKIDRKLVATAARSPADRLLCEHLIALAHGFGMKVVAVGIEDEPTMDLFRRLGCDSAQGYLVGKSMSDEDFLAWTRANA
jgi:diguanylate cyclase (GGDEF)-like protein